MTTLFTALAILGFAAATYAYVSIFFFENSSAAAVYLFGCGLIGGIIFAIVAVATAENNATLTRTVEAMESGCKYVGDGYKQPIYYVECNGKIELRKKK